MRPTRAFGLGICTSGDALGLAFDLLPPIPAATGLWRSLVAHLTGGQVVAGSNPVSPTTVSPTREVGPELR